MPTDRYHLEIYHHDDRKTALAMFSSDVPFLSINKGDLIDPGVWPESGTDYKQLRVLGVRHIIIEGSNGPEHKICVYVIPVADAFRAITEGLSET